MRLVSLGQVRWAAALLVAALSLGARAGEKHATATITADAGKMDVDGAKGASKLNSRRPLVLHVEGPGALTLGIRAKLPAREVRVELFLDGKKARTQRLDLGRAKGAPAGPERLVTVDVARGGHTLKLSAKGGEAIARIVAPDLEADLPLAPLPPTDLPIEELAATAPASRSAPLPPPTPTVAEALASKTVPAAEPESVEAPPRWRVHLQPFAAVGTVGESGFSSPMMPGLGAASSQLQVGALALTTHGPLSLLGEVRDGFYHRAYVTRWGGPEGGLPTLQLDEQNLALGATVGYELIHLLSPRLAKTLEVSPFAGPAARLLLNDAVPQSIVGIEAGARAEWAASRSLVLSLSAGWLGNWSFIQALAYHGVPLLLGAPSSATDVRVAALVKLAGPANLRVAWDSELMVLELAYRSYQAMSVSLDYGF